MANEKEWEAIRFLIKRGRKTADEKEFIQISAGIASYLSRIRDGLFPKQGLFQRIKSWLI